jgi:hypothetical protein
VPTSSAHVCNRPDSSATGARRRATRSGPGWLRRYRH